MAQSDLVLITGASGGLGVVISEYLLDAGWTNLVCQYRSRPDRIAAVLAAHGLDPSKRLFQADLTDEEQVTSLHNCIHDSLGPVFGLVNLVGASKNGMSWKLSRSEFEDVLSANLLSTFLACREFVPEMRSQMRGRIVNTSSVVAYTGAIGAAAYSAAKAAIIGLSKSLALELASKNIVVSTLALGYFEYGLIHSIPAEQQQQIRSRIPAARFGRQDEVGGMLAYLLGDGGAYASGQVFHLNGGLYS
jgi:3-oxoacyl-[acyl-carrier protein] reductase